MDELLLVFIINSALAGNDEMMIVVSVSIVGGSCSSLPRPLADACRGYCYFFPRALVSRLRDCQQRSSSEVGQRSLHTNRTPSRCPVTSGDDESNRISEGEGISSARSSGHGVRACAEGYRQNG